MDAAQDNKRKEACKILESQGFEVTLCGNPEGEDRIQQDAENCSFYSYDHLVNSSRIDDFFERVYKAPYKNEEGRKYVLWREMPATFIKNAQSITYLKKAYEKNPSLPASPVELDDSERGKKMTVLHQYLDKNAGVTSEGKRQQKGINRIRARAKMNAEINLKELSEADLKKVLHGKKEEYLELLDKMKDLEKVHQEFVGVMDELSDRSSSSESDEEYNVEVKGSRPIRPQVAHEASKAAGMDKEGIEDLHKTMQQKAVKLEKLLTGRLSPKLK
jgi:hypothetical protein